MEASNFLGEDPYLDRQDTPHVRQARPLSQGDVFVDIPLVRAAKHSETRANQFIAPTKIGPNALGMLVTHPCSSRSRSTHALKESVSIAPVRRCPKDFRPPWAGYYEYFPLPGLRDGEDYVADLAAICPVRSEYLSGHRIACLSTPGLAALFHRLAVNSSRLVSTVSLTTLRRRQNGYPQRWSCGSCGLPGAILRTDFRSGSTRSSQASPSKTSTDNLWPALPSKPVHRAAKCCAGTTTRSRRNSNSFSASHRSPPQL